MIFGHQYHRNFTRNETGNDMDMLQTDVMRFFAIICLCLMAVFSLVKSLPISPLDPRPQINEMSSSNNETTGVEKGSLQNLEMDAGATDKKLTKGGITPESPDKQKGFTLRFESSTTLDQLISKGDIEFLAITGSKVWKLYKSSGKDHFLPHNKTKDYYEMTSHTVPERYRKSFEKSVAAFGDGTAVWGVTLPVATRSRINELIRQQRGGSLVIGKNAVVRME